MQIVASKDYHRTVHRFDVALIECHEISRRFDAIPSRDLRMYYGSLLFTTLCVRCVSLASIVPRSRHNNNSVDVWDAGSIAMFFRSFLDLRLSFFYLCVDNCGDQQADARINLFHLHDCVSRSKLFDELGNTKEADGFRIIADQLRERLRRNRHFMTLTAKERGNYLKGRESHFEELASIARKVGMEIGVYKALYRYASNYVHALPMSFERLGKGTNERGRGVHSSFEEGTIRTFVEICTDEMIEMSREMIQVCEPIRS